MKDYRKPVVEVLDESCEGVYAASGSLADNNNELNNGTERQVCRFGRREANPGSDTCQACSYSNGLRDTELDGESLFRNDFTGCPDGFPVKGQ